MLSLSASDLTVHWPDYSLV